MRKQGQAGWLTSVQPLGIDVSLRVLLVLQWYYMKSRQKLQIDAPDEIRERAKAVAYDRGSSLTDFVLEALSKMGDVKLSKLIAKELENKTKPGRPTLKK
jgi:hypothetical protein